MAVAVPGQGGDPIALLDARLAQRMGHLCSPMGTVAPGVAVNVPLNAARNDFDFGVVALGMLQQAGHEQRHVHHQSLHGALLKT